MTTNSIASAVHHELIRHLIARQITCPVTGDVLDIRTAVPLLDRDGDPARMLSPAAADLLRQHPDRQRALLERFGLSLPADD